MRFGTMLATRIDPPSAPLLSAARYLQECLNVNEYWDVPVAEQTPAASTARVLEFLDRH